MFQIFSILWLFQALHVPGASGQTAATPQIAFRAGHRERVLCQVFSPNGKWVATGSEDGIIKLWEARSGELLHTMQIPHEIVYSLAFSPDSATLASGSSSPNEGEIRTSHAMLWDTASGTLRLQLGKEGPHSYHENVIEVAYPPHTAMVAVCTVPWDSNSQKVDLWDARTGMFLRRLSGVNNPEFSPDGPILAAVSTTSDIQDNPTPGSGFGSHGQSESSISSVKLWDLTTGAVVQTLDVERLTVLRMRFSPDGKTLAVVAMPPGVRGIYLNPDPWHLDGKPDTIFLWDTQTGAKQQTLVRNTSWIGDLTFAPDGKTLVSANMETHSPADPSDPQNWPIHTTVSGEVVAWDVATGKPLQALPCGGQISSLAYSPDGSRLVVVHGTEVSLWNPATGAMLHTVSAVSRVDSGSGISYAPDGKTLVACGGSGSVRWLDPHTLKLRAFAPGQEENTLPLAFAPDGRLLVSGGVNGDAAQVWDLRTGRLARHLPSNHPYDKTLAVAFAPDSQTVATLDANRSVFFGISQALSLWDARSGRWQAGLQQNVQPNAVHSRARIMAMDTQTAVPLIWNALAFAPDGLTLVTGGRDYDAPRVNEHDQVKAGLAWWDVRSGTRRFKAEADTGEIYAVAIAPNGQLLATSGQYETILWGASTGKPMKRLRTLFQGVVTAQSYPDATTRALAFSPDSKMLASGDTHVVRLWDVASGIEIDRLIGHTGSIHAVAFSPDGRCVASASEDGSVRLWDLDPPKDWEGLKHLLPDGIDRLWGQYTARQPLLHDHPVTSVAFSPDGRLLVSGSTDQALHFWNARTGALFLTTRVFPPSSDRSPPAWISYTPEGYYEGSSNVNDYLRWQVGDRLLPAATFARRHHRPDRVEAALKTLGSESPDLVPKVNLGPTP